MINPTICCMIEYKHTSNFVGPSIPTASGMGSIPRFPSRERTRPFASAGASAGDWRIDGDGIFTSNFSFNVDPWENKLGRLPVGQRNKTCQVGRGFRGFG